MKIFLAPHFRSVPRIEYDGQENERNTYQSSKLDDYLYSYLYLCTRRRSSSVDRHSFPARSPFSPLIVIPDKSIGFFNGNDFMKWHNKTYFTHTSAHTHTHWIRQARFEHHLVKCRRTKNPPTTFGSLHNTRQKIQYRLVNF